MTAVFYSKDDVFNYYFLNLIIIAILLKCFYKNKIYKHHILSIVLVSIVSFCCMVAFYILTSSELKIENGTFSIDYENKYYIIIIFSIIYLIISPCFCIGIIFQKNLMHSQFISSYKFLFYKGIFGICFCIITLIFTSIFSCPDSKLITPDKKNNNQINFSEPLMEKAKVPIKSNLILFIKGSENLGQNDENKGNLTKIPYEPIKCKIHYKDQTYLDNFIAYFENDRPGLQFDVAQEVFILLGYFILNFITNISIIFVNKFLSPFHVLITECFYSLIHTIYQISISNLPNKMDALTDDSIIRKIKWNEGGISYDEFFNNWQLRLVKLIAVFFEFRGYLIYMEIIQLNFLDLIEIFLKILKKGTT